MFRKMRRFKQEISKEECIEVLNSQPRGVLAVLGDDDYPYTVPIDFIYDEETNTIGFHGAREGHKIDAIMTRAIKRKATGRSILRALLCSAG